MRTDEIMDLIDNQTHPDQMTKPEALEYLQDIAAQLVGRIEALQEEITESE
jgi:hypothetical protein